MLIPCHNTNKYQGEFIYFSHRFNVESTFLIILLVGSGENYVIENIVRDDAGVYVCEASNPEGVMDSRNITVDVECRYYTNR